MSAITRAIVIALAAFMLAGCATPSINWQARVGVYTYDNAMADYGTPDRYTKLGDGSIVAEWMLKRSTVVTTPGPYYYQPDFYYGPVGPARSATYVPGKFLRLTFSPNGKLTTWKEYSK